MTISSTHSYHHQQFSILAWLLLLTLLVHSCKENKMDVASSPEKVSTENQISYITYGTDINAEKWYEYNKNGDLIRQSISKDTIVFEYLDHKIIKKSIDKKLKWLSKVEYSTDQNGRIISSLLYDDNDQEISKYRFEYNDEGFLSKTIQDVLKSGATYIIKFVYQNGNLTEVLECNHQGQYSSKYVCEYYTDMPNVFNMPFHHMMDDIFPNERLGKMNRNMIKQMSNISKEGDTLSLVKYQYDPLSNGKLKEYQTDVLNEYDTELIYHFTKNKN